MLFKYRNLCDSSKNLCPRTMEIIELGRVFIPSIEKLNDPFEKLITFTTDQSISSIKELASAENIEKAYEIDPGLADWLKETYEDCKEIESQTQEIARLYHELYEAGIYSLSEVNDSIIMWSHYAKNHEGVCIGFDRKDLENTGNLIKVKYVKKAPTELTKTNRRSPAKYFHKHKYFQWSYEKEFRLILEDTKDKHIDFPAKIKAIYYGAKVKPEFLAQSLPRIPKGIDVYIFKLSEKDFKLHPEKINR